MKKPNLKFKKPDLGRLNSDLKMPSLRMRGKKISTPKTSIKAPKVVSDLYADLRDRRLLPLVALLIVAILAVPFLLGGDKEDDLPPPIAAPGPEAGKSTAPASFTVVPADPGLREIHERLGYRKARDPFRVPRSKGEGGGSQAEEAQAPAEEGVSGGGSGSSGSGDSGGVVVNKTTTNVTVKTDVTEWGVDIKAGFVGKEEKDRDHVREMTPLPNKQNPIVTFIGLNADNSAAIFLMSSEVTAYYGKGVCVGDKQSCQTLELKPGNAATFAVGFGETRYKLQLKQIIAKVRTYTEKPAP